MGRRPRSKLDLVRPNTAERVESKLLQQKVNHDVAMYPHVFQKEEEVYARNFGRGQMWFPGRVVKHISSVSCLICGTDGRLFRRHQDHMRPRQSQALLETDQSNSELPGVEFPVDDASDGETSVQPSQREGTLDNSAMASQLAVTQTTQPAVSSHRYPRRHRTEPDRYRPRLL